MDSQADGWLYLQSHKKYHRCMAVGKMNHRTLQTPSESKDVIEPSNDRLESKDAAVEGETNRSNQ